VSSGSKHKGTQTQMLTGLIRFVNTTTSDVKADQAKDAEAVVKELENLKKKENYLETTLKNSQEHMEAIFKRAG
jgi:prefoldin subunit 1